MKSASQMNSELLCPGSTVEFTWPWPESYEIVIFRDEWLSRMPGNSHRIVRMCESVVTSSGIARDGVIRPIGTRKVARSGRRIVSFVVVVVVGADTQARRPL